MSPTFRSLSHPNYRRYAAGSLVSNTGTWMQRVAQDWLVLLLTGSGAAIGITTGLQFLPFLLLSPWAGLVADRIPKRRLLQMTNIGMAVPAVVLGLLAVTGTAEIWHVYVLALVLGVASAFDAPARQSFVSEIVGPDDLTNAVGLNSASFNTARLVGPALAGLLIAGFGGGVVGTGWVILLNGLSYAAPVLTLRALDASLLRTPEPSSRRPGQVREGVAYVRGRPDLLLLLGIVFSAGTFGLNFQMTSALMATEVFDKGPTEYGLLGTFLAVGSLTGSLVAARRVQVRHRLVVGAALAFGSLEVVAGLAPSYVVFALLCPLLGLSALTMITSANAHLQLSTAPEMRGRVMALYMMIFIGGTPLGAPFIGWVGEAFGARWTLVVGGLLTVLGTLLSSLLFLGGRRVLTGLRAPGSLVPRVWDNQAVARARK
ncbi:MFS transporter [Nocardioides sp. OK12]|uniref:MFS family permease n=1 Tax=Nocardioides marinisabuli TaxID=419476 RepID=A0A7Y9JNX5_9ACTN|nr:MULTISPECIES: MFS transporter [Nocardioides]NYD56332.1 MFS family permease [Nocardioides marinisabuli]GHJ59011.1 MFS transporter [Nocardioides sp. OK12]